MDMGRISINTKGIIKMYKLIHYVKSNEKSGKIVCEEMTSTRLENWALLMMLSMDSDSHKRVWTNGVFDILHLGHLELLSYCRKHGHTIVGINSDESTKNLDKLHPLINTEMNRATMLASFRDVDHVIIYNESTATNCIKTIKPDYYIKGGDYTIERLDEDEKKAVESYGGKVLLAPYTKGESTSEIYREIYERGYTAGYNYSSD